MLLITGMTLTLIMILLLSNSSFYGNRKITTCLILCYALIYFFVLQNSLIPNFYTVLNPLWIAFILITYLTATHWYINQKLNAKELLKIVLFIAIPMGLCFLFETNNGQFHRIDIFILALIIITTQLRFIEIPMIKEKNVLEFYGLSVTSDLLVLFIFLWYRKIKIDLHFIDTLDVWLLTLLLSFLCCITAASIGLKLGYLSFKREKYEVKKLIVLTIFNFLHVTISEEIIYRMLVYNYLRQFMGGGDWLPFLMATLLFGCHHISFGGKKLFVLSLIAGFFYGLIYVLTKNLLTAVIIHTIVNMVWRSFFTITNNPKSAINVNL